MPTLSLASTSPRVSVVMPIYNTQAYLAKAIESIQVQTLSDFELILADDGSTDESLKIARSYARRDPRLVVLAFPHQGLVTINQAVARARAPLVARMDADDTVLPRRLARQWEYLEQHPECVAVGTWLVRTDPQGHPCGHQTPPPEHEAIDALLLQGDASGIVNGTTMFRREVWLGLGGLRTEYGFVEDLDLYLRLAEAGRLGNVPEVLYCYRRHLGSTCAVHYQQMVPQVERVLRAAWERRGLPGEPDLEPARQRLQKVYRPADYFRSWACYALENGDLRLARQHAWQALKRQPWSVQSWKVAYWSLAA